MTANTPSENNTDQGALVTLTAAGANTVFSPMQNNVGCSGLLLVIDITAISASTLIITIQGFDVASGKFYTLLASAALAAVGTTVLTVYPGQPTTANISANTPLPKNWRISATTSGTSCTATIGASTVK